ncbi:MAG: hypothetical protein CFE44_04775 [Burkholderiales bacterium PBB4]|nr:MAG: hypothetical protein CFE44_04775 [Burkholderiales bacterium PBB4]
MLAFAGDPLRITSQMRDIWLDTLSDLPGTVLRLAGLSPELQAHWQTLANDRSVAPEALQFFDLHHPTSLPEALMDADLFLDTFPMGSPEVAGCALACGIPVVTARGASMASRMTSGMLSIAGLEELVAQDLNTYAALLKSLVQDRDRQHALQRRVRSIPESHPLFDAHQWVYNLQKVFEGVHATLPPAPPQASYSAQTLAYLRPLASESALGPRTDAGRRYVIAAPPYQHNSAGIRVLYDLQRWLVCAGLDAIVCTWFQGYPVEQFVDDIVIYPEVAPGNLLQAKRVVRYILNTPGKLGHGEKHYGADEVLVAYNRHLAPYADGRVLQVPSIEPFFHARGRTGGVNAFYVGKGKNLGAHPEGCIEITKAFPATRSAMANFLRTVDTLYTYDDFTMLAPEAQRCGCRVLLIHREGTIGECPMEPFPSEEEFRVQLHEFIELTRRL